jgi:hypothetical protein
MLIEDFVKQNRLKITKDNCGDPIITGRIGQSNIYEYSDAELGVMFITGGKKSPRTGLWNKFKAACLGVGMTPRQVGDAEGSFSFDPTNSTQAKVAIKGIRARVKRQMTRESLARLATMRQSIAQSTQKPLVASEISL